MSIKTVTQKFRAWLPFWTILALVLGFVYGTLFPHYSKILKSLIIPSSFILIYMMCIPLKMENMVNSIKYPRELLWGLLFSLVLAPLLMWPEARILVARHPEVFAGLMLAGVVPPGGMITFWTGILDAEISLAMVLQIVTFVVSIFWIPLSMQVLAGAYVPIQYMAMFKNLLIIIVGPLILGMITRRIIMAKKGEKGVVQGMPYFQLISGLFALLLVFIATGVKAKQILQHPGIIYLPAIAALIYYTVTFYLAGIINLKWLKIPYGKAIPLIFGTATKNLSIAMALAVTTFGPQALLGVIACSLFQMPLASLFYKWYLKYKQELNIEPITEV